jgi:hypothetical protein
MMTIPSFSAAWISGKRAVAFAKSRFDSAGVRVKSAFMLREVLSKLAEVGGLTEVRSTGKQARGQ